MDKQGYLSVQKRTKRIDPDFLSLFAIFEKICNRWPPVNLKPHIFSNEGLALNRSFVQDSLKKKSRSGFVTRLGFRVHISLGMHKEYENASLCSFRPHSWSLPNAGQMELRDLRLVSLALACEQQTHFRSSLLRRQRSDDRKCVCCSQATLAPTVERSVHNVNIKENDNWKHTIALCMVTLTRSFFCRSREATSLSLSELYHNWSGTVYIRTVLRYYLKSNCCILTLSSNLWLFRRVQQKCKKVCAVRPARLFPSRNVKKCYYHSVSTDSEGAGDDKRRETPYF